MSEGQLSRRGFLKIAGVLTLGLTAGLPVRLHAQETDFSGMISEVERMSLSEMQDQIFKKYPVIPDIPRLKGRLNKISNLSSGVKLMKSGSSVSMGMLGSIFS